MLSKDFEGKNEKEAIKNAVEELGIEEKDLKIEILEKPKKGLLGFSKQENVKIRASYMFSGKENLIRNYIENLLKLLNIEITSLQLQKDEANKYSVDIEMGDESSIVIGKKGKNLDAIQTLITNMVNKDCKAEDEWDKVLIDICGYRKRREQKIIEIAHKAAREVKNRKRPKLLEPMNPFERRIIHLALKNDEEVETKSEGEGIYRKIKIIPKLNINYNR